MHKVLIPIDFSDASINAARYASELFCGQPTEFILFYAKEPVPSKKDLAIEDPNHSYGEAELGILQNDLTKSNNYPGHSYAKAVINQDAVTSIVEYADDWKVSSIFMGKTGRSAWVDKWLGGITIDVMRYANKPVIAVPVSYTYEPLKHIALATDFEPMETFKPMDFLLRMVKMTRAGFTVVNVQGKKQAATMEQTMAGLQLDKYLEEFPHRYEFSKHSSTPDGIVEFTNEHRIDMLAMINRGSMLIDQLFTRSTIQKVSQHLNIPLLVLPTA